MELQSSARIELTEKTLLQLINDLYHISANNCEQLFPTISQFVHEAYKYYED